MPAGRIQYAESQDMRAQTREIADFGERGVAARRDDTRIQDYRALSRYGQIDCGGAKRRRCDSVSSRIGVFSVPNFKSIQSRCRIAAVPPIVIAPLFGDVIDTVVDGFVAVSKDGTVGFDLIVACPYGPRAWSGDKAPALWRGLPRLSVDGSLAEPRCGGANCLLLPCGGMRQFVHEHQQDAGAFA